MLKEEAQSYEDCCEGEGDEEVVELGVVRSRLEVRPGDVGGKPDTGRPEHRAQAAGHGALSETSLPRWSLRRRRYLHPPASLASLASPAPLASLTSLAPPAPLA